jgi:hypothetical protein
MRAKRFAAVLAAAAAILVVATAAGSAVTPWPVGSDATPGDRSCLPPRSDVAPADTTGDHPPTTAFTLKGKYGTAVSALPYDAVANPSGTFIVSGIPAKSKVVKALLYLTDWEASEAAATFAGASFGPAPPVTTNDGGGHRLGVFRFDVTSKVKGNGSYDYSSSGIAGSYGSALVVLYRNKTLLSNFIWVNDGSENMCNATSESLYSGGPKKASDGRLLIFTEADDNIGKGETGEVVSLNGNAVGGPLDANLGHYASLLDLPVTGVGAKNTVSVMSPQDWFGWHLAILSTKRQ